MLDNNMFYTVEKRNLQGIYSCILLLLIWDISMAVEENCLYCQKKFKVLGRHTWRCAAKLQTESLQDNDHHGNVNNIAIDDLETPDRSITNVNNELVNDLPEGVITNYDEDIQNDENRNNNSNDVNANDPYDTICYCGKKCKGVRGLQAH